MIPQLTAARIFAFLAFPALVAVLEGCDNAVVNVTDSRWKTIAMDTAQLPPSEKISTTPIAGGDGTVVNAGDLVKMRIGDGRRKGDGTEWAQEAWYWTGYLPADLYHYGATAPTLFGGLLVGRHVGEKFLLEPQEKDLHAIQVRLSGLAEPDTNRKGGGQMEAFNDSSVAWDLFTLRKSTIEIVASCPVKLSIRMGQMTQWGYILNIFGMHYPSSRRGALYWSAIDAECPQPDDKVRFMIGPIYFSPTSGSYQEAYQNETLYNWWNAYLAERPQAKYPDEHQHVVIGGKWIHREDKNQHWVDVASPAVHAAAPPGSGGYSEAASPVTPHELRNSKVEGYAWAMDNNIESAADCNSGTPEFIDGCKSAVERKAAHTRR
jgi:hypothetical protein